MRHLVLPSLLVAVASCGGESPPPPVAFDAARIEIAPATLLMPRVGDVTTLEVRAFDALGALGPAPDVVFTSSNPAAIAIDGDRAIATGFGSARIVATAGDLRSGMSIVVAEPIAGAVMITDSMIDGDIDPVDPVAPFDVGFQYRVRLPGVAVAPGGAVIGTGSLPVGGVVRAVDGDVVTLEVVPVDDLFPDLRISETFDVTDSPAEISDEVREVFDITETAGGGYVIALKPGQTLSTTGSSARVRPDANGDFEFAVGPVECKVELSAFQLSIAKFEATIDPGLTVDRVWSRERKRFVLTSNGKASINVKPVLQSQLEGKLTCELKVAERYFPLPGPIGAVAGFTVPVGIGFEVEGKTPIFGGASWELKREVAAHAVAGIDCTSTCTNVGEFTDTTPPFTGVAAPSNNFMFQAGQRAELSAYGYLFGKLQFGGSPTVRSAGGAIGFRRVFGELLVLKAGLKLEGKIADEDVQARDPMFSGEYRLLFEAGLEPGKTVEVFFKFIKLTFLKPELKLTQDIATSPKGAVSVDKAQFDALDTLALTVDLMPSTVEFPLVGWNVRDVSVYRRTSTDGLVLLARQAVAQSQTRIEMTALTTEAGSATDIVAFVTSNAVEGLPIELASPVPPPTLAVDLTAPSTLQVNVDGTVCVGVATDAGPVDGAQVTLSASSGSFGSSSLVTVEGGACTSFRSSQPGFATITATVTLQGQTASDSGSVEILDAPPVVQLTGRATELRVHGFNEFAVGPNDTESRDTAFEDQIGDGFSIATSPLVVPPPFTQTLSGSGGYSGGGLAHGSMSARSRSVSEQLDVDSDGVLHGGSFSLSTRCTMDQTDVGTSPCRGQGGPCERTLSLSTASVGFDFTVRAPTRLVLSGVMHTEGFDVFRLEPAVDMMSNAQLLAPGGTISHLGGDGGNGGAAETTTISRDIILQPGTYLIELFVRSACGESAEFAPLQQTWDGDMSLSFTLTPAP